MQQPAAPALEITPVPVSHYERHYQARLAEARAAVDAAALRDLAGSRNGYVRQAALERCVQLAQPELLPVVASRLNDWVLPVRLAARTGMEALLPMLAPPAILSVMGTVARLRSAQREDHGPWIEQFELAVCRQIPVAALLESARSASVEVSRASLDLLIRYRLTDLKTLVALGLGRRDDIRAGFKVLALGSTLAAGDRLQMYQQALRSHFGAVRVRALRTLLQDDAVPDKPPIAFGALMDRQLTVRAAAIFYLKQAGHDPAPACRKAVLDAANSAQRSLALASLSSCGDKDDRTTFRFYATTDETPSVRAAALFGWLRVAPDEKDQIAALALADGSPRVRRFASVLVNRHKAYVPRATVMAAIARTQDLELRSMLSTDTVWDLLEAMAHIAIHNPQEYVFPQWVVQSVHRQLGSPWRGTPTAEQKAVMATPLARQALTPLLPAQDAELAALLAAP